MRELKRVKGEPKIQYAWFFKCEALLHGAFSARTRARAHARTRAHRYPCGHLGKDKAILRLGILRSPLSLKETSAPPPKLQLTVIQGALKKL